MGFNVGDLGDWVRDRTGTNAKADGSDFWNDPWNWFRERAGLGDWSGGGSGTDAKIVSQTLPTVTPEQMSWLQAFMHGQYGSQQNAAAIAAALAAFKPPDTTMGWQPSGTTQSAIEKLLNFGDSQAAWQPDPMTRGVIESLMKGVPFDKEQSALAFEKNVSDPMLREFTEKIQPSIAANLSGSLFSSGTRRAGDVANRELLTALTAAKEKNITDTERFLTEQTTTRMGMGADALSKMNQQTLEANIAHGQQALDSLFAAGKLSSDVDAQRLDAMKAELNARMTASQQQLDALVASGQISNEQSKLLALVMAIPQIENIAGVDPGDPSNRDILLAILAGLSQGAGQGAGAELAK